MCRPDCAGTAGYSGFSDARGKFVHRVLRADRAGTAGYSGFFPDARGKEPFATASPFRRTVLAARVLLEERCLQREVSSQRAPSAASAFGRKERSFRAPVGVQTGFRVPRPFKQAEGAGNTNPRSRGNRNHKSAREPHRVSRGAEQGSFRKPRYSGSSA